MKRLLLVIVVVALTPVVVAFFCGVYWIHSDGYVLVEVRGRLVESTSQRGVARARLLTVSAHEASRGKGWDAEQRWEAFEALQRYRTASAGGDAERDAYTFARRTGGRTGEDGAFVLPLGIGYWWNHRGPLTEEGHADPADHVGALWIAREGRVPVIIRVQGRLRKTGLEDGPWGIYELGTVELPPDP